MLHQLKAWPRYYRAVAMGTKKFEVRREEDRQFAVGDVLLLQEWDPDLQQYTGNEIAVQVSYVLRGPELDIPEGMVVMSISPHTNISIHMPWLYKEAR